MKIGICHRDGIMAGGNVTHQRPRARHETLELRPLISGKQHAVIAHDLVTDFFKTKLDMMNRTHCKAPHRYHKTEVFPQKA